jgi:HPt (histidine-containing phosphotransfer) domain-containing protein
LSHETPIDLAHLAQYTGDDKAAEAEVLGMVEAQAAGYIAAMEASGGGENWLTAAHGLKGMASGVGAWELTALAERAEHADAADPATREACTSALREALTRVAKFIEGHLKC